MMNIRRLIHKIAVVAALTCCMAAVSCSYSNEEPNPGPDPQPEPTEVPTTVLVYMAANTDLGRDGFDEADLSEMRAAVKRGALQGNRLLVYRKSYLGTASLFEITVNGEKTIAEYTDNTVSSVNASRMSEVIEDARTSAPSRQFGLILWGHGNGWLQNGITENTRLRTWGNEGGRTMNITTLQSVLEPVKPDWVYFDCCYMATVEVAYQLRNATAAIVGSVTELPSEGMPYDLTLPYLLRPEGADLTGAAAQTFGYYNSKTSTYYRTCTMSVIATAGMDALASAASDIHLRCAARVPDGYQGKPFALDKNGYFFDLDHYMQALCDANAEAEPYRSAWNEALSQVVLYSEATEYLWASLRLDAHCGLSTLLMTEGRENYRNYSQLDWPVAAGLLTD